MIAISFCSTTKGVITVVTAWTILRGRAEQSSAHRYTSLRFSQRYFGRVSASPWQPSQVPNPNTQHEQCNIPGIGGLCDPDALLSSAGRVKVLDALTAVRLKTNLTCPDGKEHGYQLADLIVQQMDRSSGPLQGLGVEDATKKFAEDIGNTWGVGDKGCENGIVMFLSIQDRHAYIKTTAVTQKVLSDSDATQVIENMKPLLRDAKYDDAVLQGTLQIYDVLMGKAIPRSDANNWVAIPIIGLVVCFLCPGGIIAGCGCFYVILVTILCFPLALIADAFGKCCHRKTELANDEREQVEQDLQRVQKELERDEFDQTICPICLESLGDEDSQDMKTLQCKHMYHRGCIEAWVAQHSNCPLCRSEISDVTLADEDAEQPESYQRRLRFYLSRVQARNESVFGSSRTYGTVERPTMYRRDQHTGALYCSDYYLYNAYGYGYDSGYNAPSYADSLNAHLSNATSDTMTWAQSVQANAYTASNSGSGSGHSSSFGGGGGFSGGGGGGGGW